MFDFLRRCIFYQHLHKTVCVRAHVRACVRFCVRASVCVTCDPPRMANLKFRGEGPRFEILHQTDLSAAKLTQEHNTRLAVPDVILSNEPRREIEWIRGEILKTFFKN